MPRTLCAICETNAWDSELYADTLGSGAATCEQFSARRTPDRVHYRMVRCRKCGLVRSDPILEDAEIARLYEGSALTYEDEAAYAGRTYARYLGKCLELLPSKGRLLEIGCGHGFFLETARGLGFDVYGVEPSRAAVERATPELSARIRNESFREGLFPEGRFSVICGFQVLDHLAHPNEVLRACRKALRPDGLALFINHDAGAWTNRLLGERSPIIDVEHVYLYDRRTMAAIFAKNGFEPLRVFRVTDRYPLRYWCKLAPMPGSLKPRLLDWLKRSVAGRLPVAWKSGNLGIVARPAGAEKS